MFPFHDDNPTIRFPLITLILIAVNILVFFGMRQMPEAAQQSFVVRHGFVPARIEQLRDPNLVVAVPIAQPAQAPRRLLQPVQLVPQGEISLQPVRGQIYASLFTTMFLHGSWMHVLGNMWFLWLFGNNIEDRLGHVVYVIFYFVGGLIATACHWMTDPSSVIPVVGASGAVAGVLGAYAVTFPHAKVKTLIVLGFITIIELPALAVLGFWFAAQLVGALAKGGDLSVAVWAHVGGFAAGAAMMPILKAIIPPPQPPDSPEHRDLFWPSRDLHYPPRDQTF